MYVYHQQEKIPLPIVPYTPNGDIFLSEPEQTNKETTPPPKTQKKTPKTKIIRKRCDPIQHEEENDYMRMILYTLLVVLIGFITYQGMQKKQFN